ncbi:MAG TPA: ABC transporter ATP-binding protein [Myxococcota bacterium]|nr:ABC transporter ATP-binding protein [Myxococcota bacterium]
METARTGTGMGKVLHVLWRCLALLRPVRGHLVGLCAGFAAVTLLLVPPSLLFLDLVWTRALQGEPLPPWQAVLLRLDPAVAVHVTALSEAVRRTVALRAVVGGAAIGAVATPLFLGLWYWQIWVMQRINQILRVELLERFQTLSLRFHSEARVGDAIYRLTQDSAMVTQLVDVVLLTPLYAIGGHLLSLAIVSAIDPRLGLLLLAAWIPALALGHAFSAPMRRDFRRARESNAALTARIQEVVAGLRVIKAYGAEAREQERFESASRAAFDAAYTARRRFALYGVLVFLAATSVLAAASAWGALATRSQAQVFGARLLAASGLTAWSLGLFQFFKDRFGDGTNYLRRFFRTWGRAQDVAIGLDRVLEILDLEPEVRDATDAVDLDGVKQGIAFRDVAFRYRTDRPALVDVSFSAAVGAITAVVGPTGAGKSTLLALLLRLFDPDRGAIEIDGWDLRRLRVASLRRQVAIALQENLLFGTTIRENIRYAAPDADDDAVREAARVACADEFIEALPLGYDTPLGERGAKLSSGQRQRLSIARAVLKDAPVLLLDEPTASLDAATERLVLSRLAAWGRGRAILLVTHRLSTVRLADQIVALEAGRSIEIGSHRELMRVAGGAYRRLVESEALAMGAP